MSTCTVSIPFRTFQQTYPELREAVVIDPSTGTKKVPLPPVGGDNVEVEVPDFFDVAYGELLSVVAPYLTEEASAYFASRAIEALQGVFIRELARSSSARKEQDKGVAKGPYLPLEEAYSVNDVDPGVVVDKVKELEALWKQAPVEVPLIVGSNTTNEDGRLLARGIEAWAKEHPVTIHSGHYGVLMPLPGGDSGELFEDYTLPLCATVVGRVKCSCDSDAFVISKIGNCETHVGGIGEAVYRSAHSSKLCASCESLV